MWRPSPQQRISLCILVPACACLSHCHLALSAVKASVLFSHSLANQMCQLPFVMLPPRAFQPLKVTAGAVTVGSALLAEPSEGTEGTRGCTWAPCFSSPPAAQLFARRGWAVGGQVAPPTQPQQTRGRPASEAPAGSRPLCAQKPEGCEETRLFQKRTSPCYGFSLYSRRSYFVSLAPNTFLRKSEKKGMSFKSTQDPTKAPEGAIGFQSSEYASQ